MKIIENYSIRDLEKLSGVKAHTIRIWEKRYGIIRPGRTSTNIRYYTNEDLKQLLNISLLNKNGYKISAISKMSPSEILNHISAVMLLKDNTEGLNESLLMSLIEMNETRFTHAFMSMVIKVGFEKAIIKFIFPFFERIGIMWQTGSINPAQEHFFSNMIRQKLIAATDALDIDSQSDTKTVVLFLPENELHEIGLLFYNYALRARGYKTIYLGQAVPFESLEAVMDICRPDYVVTGVTNSIHSTDFQAFYERLQRLLPDNSIFLTGPVPKEISEKDDNRILTVKDLLLFLNIQL